MESHKIEVSELFAANGWDGLDAMIAECMSGGSVPAVCSDGCWVETDGTCPHGNESVLLVLGMI